MTTDYKVLSITDSWPSPSYERCYQDCLYHRKAYLESQPQLPTYSYFLTVPERSNILAAIHFDVNGKHAVSQRYAPFGSIISGSLSKEVAGYFLASVFEDLEERQIEKISIYHPSPCYGVPPVWEEVLNEAGFSGRGTINHHLVVDNRLFSQKIHKMEQRKLAKSVDFEFRIQPHDQLRIVYDFILDCRIQKHQELSLSYERLAGVFNRSSDNFLICTVFSGTRMAAASIIIKVNPNCWYQFYPAHHCDFDKQSPMVFLTSELYGYARNQGINIIDLGTSELNDQPIAGLLKFKSHLGGIPTQKTLYTKTLSN